MNRKLLVVIIAGLFALRAFADSESTPIPAAPMPKDEKPEIAFRLFSNWADNYQVRARKNKAIAEGILFSTGALSLGGAALTWFAGDRISENCSGSPMDSETKRGVTLGLGITGGALVLSGIIVAAVPIKDYRAIYSDVFEEKDPEVREAMAVSVLRYQSDRGKERRVSSFIWSLALPIIAGAVTIGSNMSNDDRWNKDLLSSMANSSWCTVGGVVSLFTKSPEERLYERYLNTRDAYYGAAR